MEVREAFMCDVAQAMSLVREGRLTRCEFRRSIDDEGYLNLFLLEGNKLESPLIVKNERGRALNVLDYDSALAIALEIGFSFDQMKVNIKSSAPQQ